MTPAPATPPPARPPAYTIQDPTPDPDSIPTPDSPSTVSPAPPDPASTGPIPMRTPSTYAPEYIPAQRIASHGSSKYMTAVPLCALSRHSAPVDCPICHRRGATVCRTETGNFTHLWAALACVGCCLGCVPYLMKNLKDVKHSCSSCGSVLAVWHRSGGGVDVIAYETR